MNIDRIRNSIIRRSTTDDEWDPAVDGCWEEMSNAITENYDNARQFLLEDCTGDEAAWISEIYQEIIEKTQDWKWVELLRSNIKRFPEEDEKYHMSEILEKDISAFYCGAKSEQ